MLWSPRTAERKNPQEIVVLPVNITANGEWRAEIKQRSLIEENGGHNFENEVDVHGGKARGRAKPVVPHGQEPRNHAIDVEVGVYRPQLFLSTPTKTVLIVYDSTA
jgi:hypothetical protein